MSAASLTVLAVMAVAGATTAAVAPVLRRGLLALALACARLVFLPRLPASAHTVSTGAQL